MLGELLGELSRVRRRRAARGRAVAGMATMLAVIGLIWTAMRPGEGRRARSDAARISGVEVRIVVTDPGILARLCVDADGILPHSPGDRSRGHSVDGGAPSADVVVEVLDDDRLLSELAAIGRPVGLVRIGDSVRLTSGVADPEPIRDSTGSM